MTRAERRPTRVAVVTGLYPNSRQPRHGIFVEERLRQLAATGEVEARVVAPVPWFFSTHERFGRYARMAAVPKREVRHGILVEHPRYLVVPKVGMMLSPLTMARSVRATLKRWRREGFDFDLIDSHYFYPDGVAAAWLAGWFRRPFVVTARGADLNQIAGMRGPGHQIRRAARRASGLVTVSRSLAARLEALGIDRDRISVLRNGVDLTRFAPRDRDADRAALGVDGPVWLCVGHLIERKGVDVAIDALVHVPTVTLLIAGDGPLEDRLRDQASRLGVVDRVRFLGAIEHDDLPMYYSAADALVLAARSEGMPNVVLEAIACGTAVIATDVDGIPEVITGAPAGVLIEARTGAAVARAWAELDGEAIMPEGRRRRRRYAEDFGWDTTTRGQLRMFRNILDHGAASKTSRATNGAAD
ncbi:glycosyltransferase family 4 protein [Salinisphaera orenii]|uniref:Glycosyl transferase family 1 n=1 Tax=Salinisphaera orenii YIM 95161 TaxID=1051139 RepID=A0A423Q3J1_9GAMM|nr:glycosyltransferase family 4 protein [Salinisphaera halophila]ROO33068.1 glycosyl transferase family 1 [Salinisphaera halophila YIM 95161]